MSLRDKKQTINGFSFLKREVRTKYKIKLILTGNTKHT